MDQWINKGVILPCLCLFKRKDVYMYYIQHHFFSWTKENCSTCTVGLIVDTLLHQGNLTFPLIFYILAKLLHSRELSAFKATASNHFFLRFKERQWQKGSTSNNSFWTLRCYFYRFGYSKQWGKTILKTKILVVNSNRSSRNLLLNIWSPLTPECSPSDTTFSWLGSL